MKTQIYYVIYLFCFSICSLKMNCNYLENIEDEIEKDNEIKSYNETKRKFIFITINIQKIELEYFEFLLSEILVSNSIYPKSFKKNHNNLIIVLRDLNFNSQVINSFLGEFIININEKIG